MTKYAKEGINCSICQKLLKKGERRANQFLCCNENSRNLTECQKKHYKLKRDKVSREKPPLDYGYIICDVCEETIKKQDSSQKRCISGIKGVQSECQKKALRRYASNQYHAATKDQPRRKKTVHPVRRKGDQNIEKKHFAATRHEIETKPGTVTVVKMGGQEKRACMKCGEKFVSVHNFNRICSKCTVLNDRATTRCYKLAPLDGGSLKTFVKKDWASNILGEN
jgi:hypothetical protein